MTLRHTGASPGPILLLHGGAGPRHADTDRATRQRAALAAVLAGCWPALAAGAPALMVVQGAVERLEAHPLFNAGRGSVLQEDGLARLSAGLMDGFQQRFSGVALASHLVHPSRLALALQGRPHRVLGPLGAQLLARELGMPPEDPTTPERIRQWLARQERRTPAPGHGTVGAVALDCERHLAACTSTGGAAGTVPERMSDSSTVAGNYASVHAAVSCTGIGEQIVDDAVAVRIETRVRDGRTLIEASDLQGHEARARGREYGWIGVDRLGHWVMMAEAQVMTCAAMAAGMNQALVAE